MMPAFVSRAGAFALVLLSLLLASCLFAPGKFTSSLDVRSDGRFSYAYSGEIHMLALSKMAEEMETPAFEPKPCYAQDGFEKRSCTSPEIADQRRQWAEERQQTAEKRRRDAESMKAILGGIDLSNPRAAEELAERLRRQAGWRRVTYRGDGVFDVDFFVAGTLDHDFSFPTIERFPMANTFVQVVRRNDGTIRVDAPGFAPASGGEPFRAMMGGVVAKQGPSTGPQIDGRFTIRTDGAILANNTDTGPQPDPAGQKLDWAVNLRTPAAPTALIRLAR